MPLETDSTEVVEKSPLARRFRGFLPVVVDVETAGFNPRTDALLEVAAVIIGMNEAGEVFPEHSQAFNVAPFEGANLEQAALDFTGIDPHNPLRGALDEGDALRQLFQPIRKAVKAYGCNRAVLVGHNAFFDHSFLFAAAERAGIKRNPFHPFSTFDTATLAALAYEHTVLSQACKRAGIDFDNKEAHSALYDAEKTAELFCRIVNRWKHLVSLEDETMRKAD
ncbi:ribonuclease T [Hahella sp. SMD15-11]|uniref:Ribonuclease T n=2 Tax=Thermohahella caldifontis TaxID=3142973 RepID=A0AB39V1P7_9GAMM